MNISFVKSYASEIKLDSTNESTEESKASISYKDNVGADGKIFTAVFVVSLRSEEGYALDVEYIAVFETEDEINDEFRNSPFPKVNAPAIAYPFLRSFISFLTLNSGYEPALLPTLNFQAMYNERNKQEAMKNN